MQIDTATGNDVHSPLGEQPSTKSYHILRFSEAVNASTEKGDKRKLALGSARGRHTLGPMHSPNLQLVRLRLAPVRKPKAVAVRIEVEVVSGVVDAVAEEVDGGWGHGVAFCLCEGVLVCGALVEVEHHAGEHRCGDARVLGSGSAERERGRGCALLA